MHAMTDSVLVPANNLHVLFKHADGWTCSTLLGPLPAGDVFTHAPRKGEPNEHAAVSVDRMRMDDFGTLQGGELRGFRPWI